MSFFLYDFWSCCIKISPAGHRKPTWQMSGSPQLSQWSMLLAYTTNGCSLICFTILLWSGIWCHKIWSTWSIVLQSLWEQRRRGRLLSAPAGTIVNLSTLEWLHKQFLWNDKLVKFLMHLLYMTLWWQTCQCIRLVTLWLGDVNHWGFFICTCSLFHVKTLFLWKEGLL